MIPYWKSNIRGQLYDNNVRSIALQRKVMLGFVSSRLSVCGFFFLFVFVFFPAFKKILFGCFQREFGSKNVVVCKTNVFFCMNQNLISTDKKISHTSFVPQHGCIKSVWNKLQKCLVNLKMYEDILNSKVMECYPLCVLCLSVILP